ncbi:MAG TPA: NAD-glutamate dehydrogenase, partial [Coxiellaceae bacterium]|nr:NAD-glutamate dehydrogenase [Coxiellaceae bacterium]
QHYLSREIIATQLSNSLVSDMGIVFVHRIQDETGAAISDIVRANTVAALILDSHELFSEIQALDYKIAAEVQYCMMQQVVQAVRRCTRWFLRNRIEGIEIESTVKYFSGFIAELRKLLPTLLLGRDKESLEKNKHELVEHKVPKLLAEKIAVIKPMYHALNIIEGASLVKKPVPLVAQVYFMLGDRLSLLWLRDRISEFPVETHWTLLARAALKSDLDLILRQLTVAVLNFDPKQKDVSKLLDTWLEKYQKLVSSFQQVLESIQKEANPEFTSFSVAIRDLMDLVRVSS